jgi:hypothetical protein
MSDKLKLYINKIKGKQPVYFINDIKATTEEFQVALYLEELQDNGYISEVIFQPPSFELYKGETRRSYRNKQLKTKVNKVYSKNNYLLKPRIYTCDFKIIWGKEKPIDNILVQSIGLKELNLDIPFYVQPSINLDKGWVDTISYLEVKASTFDMAWTTRYFSSRTQPWVYESSRIYVQLIKPLSLLQNTFIPKKLLPLMYYRKATKKNKVGDPKYKFLYKNLNEYINEKKNNR